MRAFCLTRSGCRRKLRSAQGRKSVVAFRGEDRPGRSTLLRSMTAQGLPSRSVVGVLLRPLFCLRDGGCFVGPPVLGDGLVERIVNVGG